MIFPSNKEMKYMDVPQSSVPLNRRTKLHFSPVDSAQMVFNRDKMFKVLRSYIKAKYPTYTLEYGYLGNDLTKNQILESMMGIPEAMKYDQQLMQIDYCLIYKIPATNPNVGDLGMIWCPSRFSSKSLNTMALYQYNKNLDEYMEDFFLNNPVVPMNVIYSFMEQKDYGLSRKKFIFERDPRTLERISHENPKFWKLPENQKTTVKAIQALSILYNPDTRH